MSALSIVHLQLFAEDGGNTGVTGADAGLQTAGEQASAPDAGAQETRRAEFDRLIREEYKDLFDEKMQNIIQKRLRSVKQAQPSQDQAGRLYETWLDQAARTQARYPGFDLKAELENPRFRELLQSRVDVRTAYEVLHQQELIPAAMAYAAQAVEQRLARSIASGSLRPAENGAEGQGAATLRTDVARMTRQQRQDIIQRVQRGERVTF